MSHPWRGHSRAALAAKEARQRALVRPELRLESDGCTRVPSASPHGLTVKKHPPEIQKLIDEALAKRARR